MQFSIIYNTGIDLICYCESQDREALHAAEVLRIKKEKALEVERLRKRQQKVQERATARQALMLKREEENTDRAWRKKEEAEVKKQEDTKQMLQVWRTKQIEHKHHFLSEFVGRSRAGFARVLK